MKTIIITTILLIAFHISYGQDQEQLYLVESKGVIGFINEKGKMVIKPKYLAGRNFSEGLAPVRLDGTYGYIDNKGTFVINPAYDMAMPFCKGMAKVYIDGKPFFIDKTGKIQFQHDYKTIDEFKDKNYAIVTTTTNKSGVIDRTGKLTIDTVFKTIEPFKDGVSIVVGLLNETYPEGEDKSAYYQVGLIDTTGKWILKYGKYQRINKFKEGYAEANKIDNGEREIIDTHGQPCFPITSERWYVDKCYENIGIVKHFTNGSSNKKEPLSVIDKNGKSLFYSREWEDITQFCFGRAFARKNGEWYLINTKGEVVCPQPFKDIAYYGFQKGHLLDYGLQLVKTPKGWGVIDTSGKFVLEPIQNDILMESRLVWRGTYVLLMKDVSSKHLKYSELYGYWDYKKNVVVEPRFNDIELNLGKDKLSFVMEDDRVGYINNKGKYIWRAPRKRQETKLNIDFMNRGYYYASSPNIGEEQIRGWSSSGNYSKLIKNNMRYKSNSLQVVINPELKSKWFSQYEGMKLFIANTTKDTFSIDAQDSRLYVKIQAKDKNGNWRDIEYLPSSWCGNSYHTVYLRPNEYWDFNMPVYFGVLKTKLRAVLSFTRKFNAKEERNILERKVIYNAPIYSNEIDGYINPGQLWNKRAYYPHGLMDPYLD
jgi:hypothetical protein